MILKEIRTIPAKHFTSLLASAGTPQTLHYQLHQSIARLAMDANLPPTRFIVVGDHMPPFIMLAERGLYDDGHVPFVDLIPRKTTAAFAAQTR